MKLLLLTAAFFAASLAFSQPKDSCGYTTQYEYDSNGRLIKESIYSLDPGEVYTLYEYEDTLLVKTIQYQVLPITNEHIHMNTMAYTYSSRILIKKEMRNAEGEMIYSSDYAYINGMVSEEKIAGGFDEPYTYRYVYKEGFLVKKEIDNNNFAAYEYEDGGRLTKTTDYRNGKFNYFELNEYDRLGRLTVLKTYRLNEGELIISNESRYYYNSNGKLDYICGFNFLELLNQEK